MFLNVLQLYSSVFLYTYHDGGYSFKEQGHLHDTIQYIQFKHVFSSVLCIKDCKTLHTLKIFDSLLR